MIVPPDDPADLELPPELMRAMGQAVLARVVDHIASLADQPACGDVGRRGPVPRDARTARPSTARRLEDLLDPLFREWIPRSFNTAGPGYLAYHPRRRHLPGGNRRPDRRRYQPLHRRLAGGPGAGAARGQRARLVPRLDGLSARPPAGCSPPAARCRSSTPSSAPASGSSAPRSARAFSTPRARPTPRSSSRQGSPASCPTACEPSRSMTSSACGSMHSGDAIDADRRAGLRPFMVVSTAGTTNTGAVDPLEAIADLCDRAGLWHHVDGAYGAFFHLVEPLRPLLAGLSRADSLTLDPHKGLFLPYGTGALLVRDGSALRGVHGVHAGYMPPAADPEFYDPAQHGPELSRGFPGLRVWLTVKIFGAAGFGPRSPRSARWPSLAAERLAGVPGLEMVAPPQLSLLAFRLEPPERRAAGGDEATRRLLERVNSRGRVMLTGCTVADRFLARLCVLSFRTRKQHVETAVNQIIEEEAASGFAMRRVRV